jgi:predicted metalloenzyme YecM
LAPTAQVGVLQLHSKEKMADLQQLQVENLECQSNQTSYYVCLEIMEFKSLLTALQPVTSQLNRSEIILMKFTTPVHLQVYHVKITDLPCKHITKQGITHIKEIIYR